MWIRQFSHMKNSLSLFAWSGNFYLFKDPGLNPPHSLDPFNGGFESSSNHARLDKSPPPASASLCAGGGAICRPRLPSNGDLTSNYGRTSPPAKTCLACEPINLCLLPRLPSNGNLPSNYGRKKQLEFLNKMFSCWQD